MKSSFTVSALLLVSHVVAFTVQPASFNSYPMNSDKAPDEHMRAESERIQTRLREQQKHHVASADSSLRTATAGNVDLHRSVDRSQFERIIVQLAAEYVQDTTELCRKKEEPEREDVISADAFQPQGSADAAPSMINERLPAFLKPIPSNSTRPPQGLATCAADSSSSSAAVAASEPNRLGKRQRVSKFLSAFFRGKSQAAAADDATAAREDDDSVAVDIDDDCPSWA
jgi:hypothetical protein